MKNFLLHINYFFLNNYFTKLEVCDYIIFSNMTTL
jgi:hypothetical protein